jgi:hypothetical protein
VKLEISRTVFFASSDIHSSLSIVRLGNLWSLFICDWFQTPWHVTWYLKTVLYLYFYCTLSLYNLFVN